MAGLRRTWDKDRYEQLAKDRLDRGDDEESSRSSSHGGPSKTQTKEEFLSANKSESGPMGSQRAFLKVRQSGIDLESKVGKTELIAPTDAIQARGAGFWCDVCSCLLKDSSSYLDHINGRKRKYIETKKFISFITYSKKFDESNFMILRSEDTRIQYANGASRCHQSEGPTI